MVRNTFAVVLLFLAGGGLRARQEQVVCATHPERWKEELHLHRQSMRARRAAGAVLAARPATVARDVGHLAILEDSDGVVARRNDFNLDRRTIAFLPEAASTGRYRFQTSEESYDAQLVSAATPVELDDDDTRPLALPFPFPFFGAAHRQVFVNSDGNLTFHSGDTAITDRSLGRVTAGPPRIAGLFHDLDPSQPGGSVRVLAEASRFVVSWVNVREYRASGFGAQQTFQIRLYPDGRIEFAYAGITTRSAVVGIAPGGLVGSSAVVSFAAGNAQEFTSAIIERFTSIEEVDIVLAAQKFYETHDDSYDYVVIFNTLDIPASPGAVAYEVTLRNDRSGYGDLPVDIGREFGSASRLQAILNMGPLSQYPKDPAAPVPARALSGDTALSILGHEAGHLFLAFASVREPGSSSSRPMLGRQSAHWSFFFNSEASVMEGNRIRDDGPEAIPRFTTVATAEGYSPLDQYLMGVRAPEDVPPTFLVGEPSLGPSNRAPQVGVSFHGTRRDISIGEIVQAEGRRTPDHTVSQRRFRFAFVVIVPPGAYPTPDEAAQVESYRQSFETYFHRAAGERAWADARLLRSLRLSTFPGAGVVAGGSITVSVSLDKPAESNLTVMLTTQSGSIASPPSVTIPRGETRASFPVRGLRAGVDDLLAEAADALYEKAFTRVQVTASPAELRLALVSGDRQVASPGVPLAEPVVLRVRDLNSLPYPGLRVRATVSAGGTIDPASATADESGMVRFRWTPGPGSTNELRAMIEGSSTELVVTALGRATISPNGVVNAASFAPGLAPGALASLFGMHLAAGAGPVSVATPVERLANTQVLVGGRLARMFFAGDRQINFVVPPELEPGETRVVVVNPLGSSIPVTATVLAALPGIFFEPSTNAGAVLVAGTGETTFQRPAAAGEVLEIYGTGLGAVTPPREDGLRETLLAPQVFLGSLSAPVLFSGLIRESSSINQVNVQVPQGLASGMHRLRIVTGGQPSNEVLVRIR